MIVWSITLIPATGSGTADAGESEPHDAAVVLDKYIEATGGKAAYDKIHNRITKQRVVHVDMDFEDSLVGYHAIPNLRHVTIESDAMGSTLQGTDGDIVWYLSDQAGTMIEHGEARATRLDNAAFDRTVNWRKYFKRVEHAGEATVDGRACHKIVMTPNHGRPETRYYDTQSHLLVRAVITQLSSHMPAITMELTYSDYRQVDGLLVAHKVERAFAMCGTERKMVFLTDSIEHNADIPPDRFDPPAQVKVAALAQRVSSAVTNAVSGDGASASAKQGRCCGSDTETASSGHASRGCGGGSTGGSGCGRDGNAASGSGTCGAQSSEAPGANAGASTHGGCGGS
jgi:hypothetical protein